MLKVVKSQDGHGYNFDITTNEGTFSIFFAGNLDLYWRYHWQNILTEETKSFTITKDDWTFYSLIDTLYRKVKDYDVSYGEEKDEEMKNYLKAVDKNNPYKLFKNNKIEWHSDDYTYEESAVLEIEQREDKYIITFNRGRTDVEAYVFSIRFCNSGSRYNPFNVLFMKMYNALKDYENNYAEENEEYHQITIEEYMEELKRVRKKNDN